MAGVVALGPWGGSGGDAFDDGWSETGGVKSVTAYTWNNIIRALQVEYNNGQTKLHGSTTNSSPTKITVGAHEVLAHVNVAIGKNSLFHDDGYGVVGLSFSKAATATIPTSPSASSVKHFSPSIIGFFGRSGSGLDQLGVYVSNDNLAP